MQKLPDDLNHQFTQALIRNNLSKSEQYFCTKWLRYYWDFCYKYHYNPFILTSLPLFLSKLQEKKQSVQQQNQAKFAIGLLYDINASTASQHKIAPVKTHSYQIQDTAERDYNDSVVEAHIKYFTMLMSLINIDLSGLGCTDLYLFVNDHAQSNIERHRTIRQFVAETLHCLIECGHQALGEKTHVYLKHCLN